MRGARHDYEPLLGSQDVERAPVQLEHDLVRAADDQERRSADELERPAGEIRPATARDDDGDGVRPRSCGDERGGGTSARAEEADRQLCVRALAEPVDRGDQPAGEQLDVEPVLARVEIDLFLGGSEQVDEQRADPRLVERRRDAAVAWAVPPRSAAVCEDDDPGRPVRDDEVAFQRGVADRDRHLSQHRRAHRSSARASSSRTSSSLVCEMSSTSSPNSSHVCSAATGTATTTRGGWYWRTASAAARIVAPVARPSSTRITVLPSSCGGPRSRSSASTARLLSFSLLPSLLTSPSSRTSTPPVAIAPIASSECPGTPTLRTTKTSSGAPSAFATSYPTGTPPRGSASTTTSSRPPYSSRSSSARNRPASVRLRNRLVCVPTPLMSTRAVLRTRGRAG